MFASKLVQFSLKKKVFASGKINFRIAYFHFKISWVQPSWLSVTCYIYPIVLKQIAYA